MCFSAPGSFGIGALLVATGSYTVKKAAKKNKSYLLFACFPIIFGVQQIIEGFVWIGLLYGHPMLVTVNSLLFTFIAVAFWPFFVPFSMLFVENNRRKLVHKFLKILVVVGAFLGAISYLPILFGILPMVTKIVHHSICYQSHVPNILISINSAIYFFLVITPFLVIPSKNMKIYVMLLFVSLIIANYFFVSTYLSVWCFFAAILSLDIAYIINKLPEK